MVPAISAEKRKRIQAQQIKRLIHLLYYNAAAATLAAAISIPPYLLSTFHTSLWNLSGIEIPYVIAAISSILSKLLIYALSALK
jgi:hypothetical protein